MGCTALRGGTAETAETTRRETAEMYALGWSGANIGFTALRAVVANSAVLVHYRDAKQRRPTG